MKFVYYCWVIYINELLMEYILSIVLLLIILERIRIGKKISWYELRRELNRIAVGNSIISLCKEVGLSII